ncbi:MAG: 30S ribosomal protein S11 [Gammaproteobacteria bacterium]
MQDVQQQIATTQAAPSEKAVGRGRNKRKRSVPEGIAHIHASFNNTIITFTDKQGDKLCESSSGKMGFKGSRKSTPFAAQVAAEDAGKRARDEFGMKVITVKVNGAGPGRESSVRAFIALGYKILEIIDGTGIPHNGCRAPKKRRV